MLKKRGMVTSERPFKCMEFEEFAHISETFSCVSRLVKVLTTLSYCIFQCWAYSDVDET